MRSLAALGLALAAASACEVATQPIVASLHGPPSSAALTVLPSSVTIGVGSSAQLSTNASDANQLQWFSSNTSVATVSSTGLVTGFSPGTALISVRFASDTANVSTATVVVASP
jgi:hypothetical protein